VWCGGNVPERGDPPPQETFLKKSGKARLNGSDDVAGAAGACKGSVAEALDMCKRTASKEGVGEVEWQRCRVRTAVGELEAAGTCKRVAVN
jgi:hypothetical protein